MSLNKFMHPRNKYRNKKPNFKDLASEYPEFAKHTTRDDDTGKVHLDFKDPSALRALTKTLLKHDFQLDIDLPSDRLVPTVPLRLNYIHWIEDILGDTEGDIRGIDIGTGSSCVYPLLGCRLNNWSFLATEMDPQNAHYATNNVEKNHMENMIKVKKVSKGNILLAAVKDSTESYHFCMCNPPFFADHLEAQAVTTSRSVDRADPFSVSTASPEESISQGGEINFISQMIDESVTLKTQIRVFTSMVGKKSSLPQLKEKLRLTPDVTFSTTEFCQGKTMRWGIAWTFDDSVSFPKSLFHSMKKEKPPLSYTIPFGAGACLYEMADFTQYIRSLLNELQIKYKEGKSNAPSSSWLITAKEKSWQNQRRKRRQIQRKTDTQQKTETSKGISKQTSSQVDAKTNLKSKEVIEDSDKMDVRDEIDQVMDTQNETDKNTNNTSTETVTIVDIVIEKCKLKTVNSDLEVKPTALSTDNLNKNSKNYVITAEIIEDNQVVMSQLTSTKRKHETANSGNPVKRICTKDSESKKSEDDVVATSISTTAVERILENQHNKSNSKSRCEKVSEKRKRKMIYSEPEVKRIHLSSEISECKKGKNDVITTVPTSGHTTVDNQVVKPSFASSCGKAAVKPKEGGDCVLKCYINLKKVEEDFVLELVWVDGESREVLHQLMQYFKNKLKAPDA